MRPFSGWRAKKTHRALSGDAIAMKILSSNLMLYDRFNLN
jgi:hypothetical protein